MSTWLIEGSWSGYTSSQEKVVHREYTKSDKFAKSVNDLGYGILYTDGTWLILNVVRQERGMRRKEAKNGSCPFQVHYSDLIRRCARYGCGSVEKLYEIERGKSAQSTTI